MEMPEKIKLTDKKTLRIIWSNGVKFNFPLKFLRDNSPDAGNKIERIKGYDFNKSEKPANPLVYEIENIEVIGGYAIRIFWKDGFSDGIYTWDLLYKLGRYLEVTDNLHQDFEHKHEREEP